MSESSNKQQAHNHVNGNFERTGFDTDKLSAVVIGDSENIAARGVSKSKTNLEKAHEDFSKANKTILDASDALQETMSNLSKKAKESVSRAKDQAAQMVDAMNKITKVLGPDFEKRLAQLEHLTSCMERLSKLNEDGKLSSVLDALRK
jgi:hypothetical protein